MKESLLLDIHIMVRKIWIEKDAISDDPPPTSSQCVNRI